ncbi:SPOSA6832_00880, partial [Sporobolomyces salmonicolor]
MPKVLMASPSKQTTSIQLLVHSTEDRRADAEHLSIAWHSNICRSPLAEAVFADIAKKRGYDDIEVDSAGTAGYHVGEEPDERYAPPPCIRLVAEADHVTSGRRSVEVCRKHGVPINSHARQLQREDFHKFDYIVGMDSMNMKNIESIRPKNSKAKVALFGSYGDGKGKDGFEKTYQQCVQYSEGLLKTMGYPQGGKM